MNTAKLKSVICNADAVTSMIKAIAARRETCERRSKGKILTGATTGLPDEFFAVFSVLIQSGGRG